MRSRSSRDPIRLLARCAAATTLCAIALACGGDDESPAPAPAPGEPAATEPAAPSGGEAPAPPAPAPAPGDETATVTEGVIPEGYPSDIPVYPGADAGPAMAMPGLGVFATFETDDTVDAILAHYRTELANNGWAVSESPDGTGVDATKEGRSVQVRARTAESGRSEIAVSVGEEG